MVDARTAGTPADSAAYSLKLFNNDEKGTGGIDHSSIYQPIRDADGSRYTATGEPEPRRQVILLLLSSLPMVPVLYCTRVFAPLANI